MHYTLTLRGIPRASAKKTGGFPDPVSWCVWNPSSLPPTPPPLRAPSPWKQGTALPRSVPRPLLSAHPAQARLTSFPASSLGTWRGYWEASSGIKVPGHRPGRGWCLVQILPRRPTASGVALGKPPSHLGASTCLCLSISNTRRGGNTPLAPLLLWPDSSLLQPPPPPGSPPGSSQHRQCLSPWPRLPITSPSCLPLHPPPP